MAGGYIYINLSESDVSIANNTSKVTANVYYVGNGVSHNYNQAAGTIYIDGSKYTFSHSFDYNGTQWIGSASKTITHNSDGSKSVSASASFATDVSLGTLSASKSLTLTKIPRASELSVSKTNPNYGESFTISLDRKVSSYTHKVFIGGDNLSWTQIGTGVGASLSYAIPKSFAQYIKSNEQGFWLKAETYNGSTLVGSKEYKPIVFPVLTSDMNPTVTIVDSDPNGFANTYGGYVVGKSRIKVALTETTYQGVAITSRSIQANSETLTSNPATTGLVTNASNKISATVIDERGGKTVKEKTITVIDWFAPSIELFKVERSNASGTAQADGSYIKVTYSIKYAPVANKNKGKLSIKYRTTGSSSWSEKVITTGTTTYNFSGSSVFAAAASSSFEVKLVVGDNFGSTDGYVLTVGTGFETLNVKADGTGIAFGKYAENSNEADFNIKGRFRKGLIVGNIDYAMTDAEYNELLTLLGGSS